MKKNDDIKLDVTSNIDEKIIDEVTDKKISLLHKSGGTAKNLRKRFIAIGSIAASFILMFSVLLVILIPMLGSDVPVYQGMTIRQESSSSMEVQEYDFSSNGITLLSASRDSGFVFLSNSNGNGNAYGHDKDNHKDKDDKPKNDIEDIVVIDVKTDDEVRYYVKPGETFIIEIHIDNPRDYEIQSFTLNGQKYANYMFKEGSTMELLLLEVTAPSEPGYVEYTIDAIKYIDGTEIKDVDMSSGDKSIKAGIAYPTAPSASITSQSIHPTSIELSVNITDPYKLIGQNELAIYLSDGESIISSKPLTVGENNITFDNLTMNKTYEYGVVTAYDLVDGKNLHKEWLVTNTITTAGAFGISNATSTQTSISFEVEKIGEVGEITSISLFDAATDDHIASGGADIREFTGLLSNHTYNLYVDFKYTSNGEEIADWVAIKEIKTIAKTEPVLSFADISVTDVDIEGKISIEDVDSISIVTSVGIYQNGTLLQNNPSNEISFSGLEYYTDYQLTITYTFDLNDGTGLQTKTLTHVFKTAPHLELNSCKIVNTNAVVEGDTIYMQVELNNPSGAIPTSIVINGQTYTCASSTTASKIFAEIVNDSQFEGGDTTLTIEKVNMTLDGESYSIVPSANNTADIFINSKLEFESIELVIKEGDNYLKRDYVFPSDEVYALIKFSNKTGYIIDSVDVAYGAGDPIKIDNETYAAKLSLPEPQYDLSFNNNRISSHIGGSVAYHNEHISQTTSVPLTFSNEVLLLTEDGIKEISTPEDLLNMNGGCYYMLKNDIDLSGRSWTGARFTGLFDGNGYSIKNMSYVGTANSAVGLFSSGCGIIKDLTLESVLFLVDGEYPVGGFIADHRDGGHVTFINCTVDENSVLSGSGSVGGFAGCTNGAYINCTSSAGINGNTAGGFVGAYGGTFIDCVSNSDVKGTSHAGGFVGVMYSPSSFTSCINRANITSVSYAAGFISIVGSTTNYDNCISTAKIAGNITDTYSNPEHGTATNEIQNCYILGENVTVEQLNSKSFYTDTLGWSEDVWDLDDLDIENGKYPTLK